MSNPGRPLITVVLIIAITVLGVALIDSKGGDIDDQQPIVLSSPPAATNSASEGAEGLDPAEVGRGAVDDAPDRDADDVAIPPAELRRVEVAALKVAGGGTVTDIDRSDDLGESYEVEVLTESGELDVALDENLERVPNLRYDD